MKARPCDFRRLGLRPKFGQAQTKPGKFRQNFGKLRPNRQVQTKLRQAQTKLRTSRIRLSSSLPPSKLSHHSDLPPPPLYRFRDQPVRVHSHTLAPSHPRTNPSNTTRSVGWMHQKDRMQQTVRPHLTSADGDESKHNSKKPPMSLSS